MQSAFVDLGLERDTFLYVSDFFEEHEDIDTVEEKPKGDRRDRGRRDDRTLGERASSGRNVADRTASERVIDEQRPAVAQTVAAGLSAPEDFEGTEEEEAGALPEILPVTAEAERSGEQRGDGSDNRFGGDRRNRRSRRRRQRGRGFPENKYAQPTTPSSSSYAEERLEEERPAEETMPDLVVLPGESLAKYRHVAPEPVVSEIVPESAPVEGGVSFSSAGEGATPHESSESVNQTGADENEAQRVSIEDAAEREAIEEEAEELELADKVLSHHDNASLIAEEEKIATVREDDPAPDPSQTAGISTHEDYPLPFEPAASVEEAVRSEQSYAEPIPIKVFEESSSFPHQEDFTAEEDLPSSESEEKEENETGTPQTATVREGNERSMHRVSRRMRRRRGGNRFAQTGETSVSSAVGNGLGVGTATALEPETRRETYEERTPEQRPERALPSISDLLKPGQEIIVQIAKEPLGQKGARITSHVALPGRYVVFMPSVGHLGVSRKIASDEERQRLKRILQAHRVGTTGGFIVRTAGEGVPEEEIAADMNFLYSLWLDIRQKAEKKPAPALLHYDLDIVQRILRDQVTEDFKSIWVDSEEMYESILTFMQRFQPALVNRVKMYTRSAPIFDAFNITQELEKALRPKVWLKSGGYIVINQTEALVAIDINTGKYVGKSNRLEDTIVKTNTEAVKEIVRQIRLRDLGGIIVVDFIDMDERKNRQKVMQALEEAMRADKAPNKILQFNDFGLVAITRKRVKQSLERTLCSPCPYCEGAGYVKSVQTVIGEILVEAQKMVRAMEGNKDVVLRVHPDVAKVLKASSNRYLEELEEILGRPVLVTGDPALHTEKFDLA
ncbi:MAG: Rne/Rng family ribonuclease [Acidobacteriaceae bacterium]|nr:Rne/Rng family ribonuclease [Acidobacteriaceae bacterium]